MDVPAWQMFLEIIDYIYGIEGLSPGERKGRMGIWSWFQKWV